MIAIAQTLDGKETFETKKELFDYVLSQLEEIHYIPVWSTTIDYDMRPTDRAHPLSKDLVGCWVFNEGRDNI